MKQNTSRKIWGMLLILVGVVIALNAVLGLNIHLMFNGWWTLFIIIPAAVSISEHGFSTGRLIWLCIGGFLFLNCQNFIPYGILSKLLVPVILVIIGASILLKNGSARTIRVNASHVEGLNDYTGVFSGQKVKYPMEPFSGCTANAIFGGVDIDLRDAIINEDIVMDVTAVFGGININVPQNVQVKVSSVPIFGSVQNRTGDQPDFNAPTIFLNATCMFGGVDIK